MTAKTASLFTWRRLGELLLGRTRNPSDPDIFRTLSLLPFFAWVGLGADGLSSSSYGPEEAWHILNNPLTGLHPHLGIFVALGTALTVFILSAAYSQIIELFPGGGGGYLVASKLLSPTAGMISGCALLIDYVLTIAISVAAGADAIFSFLPSDWAGGRLAAVLAGILLIAFMNLHGTRESVSAMVPIFLVFVLTHAFGIGWAVLTHLQYLPATAMATAGDVRTTASSLGWGGLFLLLMKAYSMGAGTYTGIEAVSNGLSILREPRVKNGRRTMHYMAISLAITAVGLFLAYLFYGIQQLPGRTLNAVLFQTMARNWGFSGELFVWVTLFSEAAILFIAAQAGFIGGPRVLANMALDHWLPRRFAMLSERLVTQNGILIMTALALLVIALTRGSVATLVVLYSINVFVTFSLSMLGMVRHWWQERRKGVPWLSRIAIAGGGLGLCLFILGFVVFFKFQEGGWLTLLVTGGLILLALGTRHHYHHVEILLRRLDPLVTAAAAALPSAPPAVPPADPDARTAVLLVNGWNGLGLHTLLNIQRMYARFHQNFVFVHIGIVDAGNFKGVKEMAELRHHIEEDTEKYVRFMQRSGFHAEAFTAVGTDVVGGTLELAPQILAKFPHSIFYGGQLVFPEETWLTRFLHNNAVFTLQRRFYLRGIPFMILPVRVITSAEKAQDS